MSGSIFGPEVQDSIPDDLSCDRCGHEYASHSHETGKCHDVEKGTARPKDKTEAHDDDNMDSHEEGPMRRVVITPCWCRNFEPPYPPAREEL